MAETLKLRPEQERVVTFAYERDGVGIFLDPGLGKTAIALTVFQELREAGVVNRALVVAPLSVAQVQWPHEIEKWEQFRNYSVALCTGPKKTREKEWKKRADIVIINPANLKWLVGKMKDFHFPNALIVDESTMIKNVSSIAYRSLVKMLPKFKHRQCLTGSFVSERPMDIFGQFRIIDKGDAFGKTITKFREKFFVQGHEHWDWNIRDGAIEEIQDLCRESAIRLSAEDWVKMPRIMNADIRVPLPPRTDRLYKKLVEATVVEIDEGLVTAENAGVVGSKLRQIAAGFVIDEDGKSHPLHDAKVKALQALIDERCGRPLLVGYEFVEEGNMLEDALYGRAVRRIDGNTSQEDRRAIIDEWNDGKVEVLLGQASTMSHGINLQYGGSAICWYTLPWSFERYDQMIRRVYRSGQTEPVIVTHLLIQLSSRVLNIDEYVRNQLEEKCDVQATFYSALEQG